MKWTKTKTFMLLISWLVLHASTLQAQLLACEQDCRTQCTQACLSDVLQQCMTQNPTFPPQACALHPGYAPQRALCSDFQEPAQKVCASSCVDAYPGGCPASDTIAPRITSIERQTPSTVDTNTDTLIWRIIFNEFVKNVDTSDFTVTGTTATVTGVSTTTGMIIDVTVSGGDLAGLGATVALNVAGAQDIADLSDNVLVNTTPTGNNNNTFAVENEAPTVTLTAPSASVTAFSVTVTFSEPVSDFVVGELTATNANISAFAGSGTTYTATVTPITVGSDIVISIAAGVATDAASNANIAATDATVITNNTGVVTITGIAAEGATLSASVSDADGVSGSVFVYQWMSNGANVGANQNTYEIQTSDADNTITVQVTYTDQLSNAENITSQATAAVVSTAADALNTISEAINNGGGVTLTVDDYQNAGVVSVGAADLTRVLSILNYAIAHQTAATDVDEIAEVEALIATIILGQDDDSDGLPNLVEGVADTDGDSIIDTLDADADNDGIADMLEHGLTLDDTDNDGIIDALDADVDGDGTLELGKVDANFDGVDDNLDSLAKLLANDANLDRDGDGQMNYLDLDSDNDGVFDVLEAGLSDIDSNGLVDAGTAVIVDANDLPNTTGDNTPNIFALFSDGTSRDLIVYGLPETLDVNEDGKLDSTIDTDRDGIIDIIDGAIGTFGSIDNAVPVVQSITLQGTPTVTALTIDYLVTFDEVASNLSTDDFSLTTTGTASGTVASVSAASGTTVTVTVNALGGSGTVRLDLNASTDIADALGNTPPLPFTTGGLYSVAFDLIAPRISSIERQMPTTPDTNADTLVWSITFDEPVKNVDTSDFSINGTTATVTGVSAATGTSVDVTASGGDLADLSATVTLSLAGGQNIVDTADNALVNTAPTGNNNNTFAVSNAAIITNNMGVVTITGAAVEGATLSAEVSDTDGVSGSVFAYQWMSNGANVGANQSTYEIQISDAGNAITVQVTYTDQLSTDENIISAATTSVTSVETDALNTILAAINNGDGTALTVDDYQNVGVVGVEVEALTRVLSILNYAITHQTAAANIDEVAEIEALIATIILGQDDDLDGLPNLVEGVADTDGDGIIDALDADADNDGIADSLEHGLVMDDTDNDGIIDALDADVDGDGTLELGKVDANFDGVDDNLDSLAELLAYDADLDRDGDGQVNYLDLDSDNDGVFDVLEAGLSDVDSNGLVDAGTALIVDVNNLPNTTGDNTPNIFALFSDGISRDLIVHGLPEAFDVNEDGKLDSTIDMDHDGAIDIIDGAVSAFGSFNDIDGDGLANHIDTDDDGDGIPDIEENPRQGDFTGMDADADGIDDGVDYDVNGTLVGTDADGNGVQDNKEMPDADNDGIADHLDNDSDNDGVTDNEDVSVNTGPDVKSSGSGGGTMSLWLVFALLGVLLARLHSKKLLVLVGLLLSMTQTQAGQWDIGLDVGQASFDSELAEGLTLTEDTDTAMQVSLAYVFNENWLAELRFTDLGEAEINSAVTIGHEVMAVNVQYALPNLPIEKMSLYILAGVAVMNLEESVGLNIEVSSAELNFGIGARYHFSDWLVRAEWASYNANNSAFMLGLHYRI